MSAPLAGLQVVQVGGGGAGALLGALLADQGAAVVICEHPTDLPLPTPAWDRGKLRVGHVDPAPLIERADVVIDGGVSALQLPRPPAAIWCRLHAGPLPSDDGLVAAATGLHEPPLATRPRFHDVPVPTVVAAAYAAVGVMGALLARRRDGHGQSVRVDLRDAAIASQELLAFFTRSPSRAFQPLQWVASPFVALHPAAEGHLFVHLGLGPHLATFLREVGASGAPLARTLSRRTLADPGSVAGVREAVRARRALRQLLASRSAVAWEAAFPHLCLAAVRDVDGWVASRPAREGGHVLRVDGRWGPGPAVELTGTPAAVPCRHVRVSELLARWRSPPAPRSRDPRPPLDGVRALDFTAVIAGPVAGRTLAELGADVLRIDDPHLRPAWVDAFHALFDRGKRSVMLDLRRDTQRQLLVTLAEQHAPDLVLQNFRPGVAERMGLMQLAPHRLSLSAFGDRGPWAARPGWEQTVQAACGMQHRYGGPGTPELFPVPVHDVVTGLFGAYGALLMLYTGQRDARASLARTSTWLQSVAAFGGRESVDGWERREGWVFRAGPHLVSRSRAGAVLASSPLVHTARRDDLGTFTVIDSPLRLSGTPGVELESRPRGWATQDVGGEVTPVTPRRASPARWWADRLRWAVGVAASRIER